MFFTAITIYLAGASAITSGFTAGTGRIWLDNVRCAGNESRLIDCPAQRQHDCSHFEDAGVTCQTAGIECLSLCVHEDSFSTTFKDLASD